MTVSVIVTDMKRTALAILPLMLVPAVASAQSTLTTISGIAGIFNVFVGVMLVLSIIMWVSGMILWAVRLGTYPTNRDEAIKILEYAVVVVFVLDVLLGVVEFVQRHTQTTLSILGFLVVIVIIAIVVQSGMLAASSHKDEKEE